MKKINDKSLGNSPLIKPADGLGNSPLIKPVDGLGNSPLTKKFDDTVKVTYYC